MKKNLRFLIFLVPILSLSFLSTALYAQKVDISQWPEQKERLRDYDALHYRIQLNLDIENKTFTGQTTVLITPLHDDFKQCVLDAEDFKVASVKDSYGQTLKFEQTDNELIVYFAKPFRHGHKVAFTVAYQGQDPKDGLRFYTESQENPALVASDSWPDGVHHWFPCNDYPNDKVTNEIIATVKKPLKVASNGLLQSVTENPAEGTTTWHWVQDLPHSTYLIVLAAAPYEIIHDAYGTIPISYWVYPRHKKNAQLVFGKTPKMMKFFNCIFGYDYPWIKYDQVIVPFGGGAESTTATVMGHRIMYDSKGEKDFSSIGIVSHELAHQWWGDLITLRSWAHAWMNESFGTYCDYLYYRFERGEDEGAVNLLRKKDSYLREARNRYIRPIVYNRYRRPQDLFDAHSYPKGAVVLHMLRFVLGDEVFFRTLKHFLHEYAFEPVDTHDFMKSVKSVSGKDMEWFFKQWVFSPGHPEFDISCAWDAEAKQVILRVRQVQDTSLGIPIYKTPVQVGLVTAQEKTTHTIWIEDADEEFKFPTPAEEKPLLVRFDEGNYLLKEWSFTKSQAELIYQLQNDDVIGRAWAASELARHAAGSSDGEKTMAALKKSAVKDHFWEVRRSCLASLRGLHDKNLADFFKASAHDAHSQVRITALAALSDFDDTQLTGFFQDRFRKDDSYLAQAEALRCLGRLRDKSSVSLLKQALEVESPRDVIRRAAQWSLDELNK